jgi:hypothetical protein
MSHEIVAHMNAIKGMTDILIRRNPKEDQKEYLAIALEKLRSSGYNHSYGYSNADYEWF